MMRISTRMELPCLITVACLAWTGCGAPKDPPRQTETVQATESKSATTESQDGETARLDPAPENGSREEPTFANNIAPIVYEQCAPCHRPGEAAPFPLIEYEDVASHAAQIASITADRIMPPWLPAAGHGDFARERRLSETEISQLADWAEAGAPLGDRDQLPPPPQWTPGWQLGEPDLIAEMPRGYALPADGLDVYRNFVFPIPIEQPRWIKAMELRPTNSRPVHHAFMLVDPTDSSRRYDAADEELGFPGMDTRDAKSPAGQFISWQPGKRANPGSDAISWQLRPGTDMVLQLHLQPTGKPESIGARVGFYFAEGTPSLHPMKIVLRSTQIDIPPGESDYVVSQEYELPVAVEVLSILPHAHYLANRMECWAELPTGEREWLLLIPRWDFNWQGDYRYEAPVELPADSTLHMRFVYDNSAENIFNPNQPPQRVRYGLNSTDEMAELWLQILVRDPTQREELRKDYSLYVLRKNIADKERLLTHDETNTKAHIDLGEAYMVLGQAGRAERHLRRAVKLDFSSGRAHAALGAFLLRKGNVPEAEAELKRARIIDPRSFAAAHDLGLLYLNTRRFAAAREHLKAAVDISPYDPVARANLGRALAAAGQFDASIAELEKSLEYRPEHQPTRELLEQVKQFQQRQHQ